MQKFATRYDVISIDADRLVKTLRFSDYDAAKCYYDTQHNAELYRCHGMYSKRFRHFKYFDLPQNRELIMKKTLDR